LGQLYEVMEARAKTKGMTAAQLLAAAPSDAEAAGLLKDEGMVLVAQMILMGQCRAFIGSYASNVAVLVRHRFASRSLTTNAYLFIIPRTPQTWPCC